MTLAQTGRHVFSKCKGEDCFRAKGVQYARLLLNPPELDNLVCHGEFSPEGPGHTGPAAACPPLGSGDQFIDIFNTHLQADDPQLCENLQAIEFVEAAILTASVGPEAVVGYYLLKQHLEQEFGCNELDSDIRKSQLGEMNTFISKVAAKDRPALIVGDFNLDGKHILTSAEYETLVKTLQLGAAGGIDDFDHSMARRLLLGH